MADTDKGDEKKKVPYGKYAFANAYNISLLVAAGAVSVVTGSWMLAVAAAAGEAIWMLFAPDSRLLRKLWFDKAHAQKESEEEQKRLAAAIGGLMDRDRERCIALQAKKGQIDKLSAENPAFTADLLRSELGKLDELVRSFIEMCVTCNRYVEYLDGVDLDGIERDIQRYTAIVDRAPAADERRQLALKNLDVLHRRKAKVAEIRKYVGTARAQLDLIENTFQLLADQILTMRSPQELSGQLDALMDGVEAVRQTTRETDRLMQAIER